MTVPGSILKTFYHWCLLIFLSPACRCHAVEVPRWLHEPVRTVSRVFYPLFHSHTDVNPQSLQCEKLDNESGQSENRWCKKKITCTWSTNTPNCITGSQCVSVKSFWDFCCSFPPKNQHICIWYDYVLENPLKYSFSHPVLELMQRAYISGWVKHKPPQKQHSLRCIWIRHDASLFL